MAQKQSVIVFNQMAALKKMYKIYSVNKNQSYRSTALPYENKKKQLKPSHFCFFCVYVCEFLRIF